MRATGSQRELGQLAKMHSRNNLTANLDLIYLMKVENISFDNTWSDSWIEIFVERRMDHLRDELMRKDYGMTKIIKSMNKSVQ